MEEPEYKTSLFLPSVALASIWIIIFATLNGTGTIWYKLHAPIPYYIYLLSEGIGPLPKYHFAISAAFISIGSCLGAQSAKQSIILTAKGAAYASIVPFLANLWTFVGTSADISAHLSGNGVIGAFFKLIVTLIMLSGSVIYSLHTWCLIAIAGILFSIIAHFVNNMRNGVALPWQGEDDKDELDGNENIYELGGSFLVFSVAVFMYGLIPGLSGHSFLTDKSATPSEIWSELPAAEEDGPWILKEKSRKAMSNFVDLIDRERQSALGDKCVYKNSSMMIARINSYFLDIRKYENWQPGKQLSTISSRALFFTESALEAKIIGWEDLKPQTRIHLNAARFEGIVHEYPKDCKLP